MISIVDPLLSYEPFVRAWGDSDNILPLLVTHLRGFEDSIRHGDPISAAQVKALYSQFAPMVVSDLGAGHLSLYVGRLDTHIKTILTVLEDDLRASGSLICLVGMRQELNYYKMASQPIAVMMKTSDHETLRCFIEKAKDLELLGIVHEVMSQARCLENHEVFFELLRLDLILTEKRRASDCDSRGFSDASERRWLKALLSVDTAAFNNDMQSVLDYAITESPERVFSNSQGLGFVRGFMLSVLNDFPEDERVEAARKFHRAIIARPDCWTARSYYEWLDIESLFGKPLPEIAMGLASGEVQPDPDQKLVLSFLEYEAPIGGPSKSTPIGHDYHQILKLGQAARTGTAWSGTSAFRCLEIALRDGAKEYGLGGVLTTANLAKYAPGPDEHEITDLKPAYEQSVRAFFALSLPNVSLKLRLEGILLQLDKSPQASGTLFALGKMLGMGEFMLATLRILNVDHGLPIEDVMKVMRLERDDVISDFSLKKNLFVSELNV